MTRAMREVREESEMYKYDKVGTLIKLHLRMHFKQEVMLEKEWYLIHFTPFGCKIQLCTFGVTAFCVAKRPTN